MKTFFNSVGSRPFSKNQREPTDFGLEAENPVPCISMVPEHREPTGTIGAFNRFSQRILAHPFIPMPCNSAYRARKRRLLDGDVHPAQKREPSPSRTSP